MVDVRSMSGRRAVDERSMVAFEFEERACHAVTWDTGISDQRMKQLQRSANVRTSLWRARKFDCMKEYNYRRPLITQ